MITVLIVAKWLEQTRGLRLVPSQDWTTQRFG
jgi:hypothetical protein